jgi:adenylate kinase family enzyme
MPKNVVCLFGLAGSGKTTLCTRLGVKWGFKRLSPAAIISDYRDSKLSQLLGDNSNEVKNRWVPDNVFIELILSAFRSATASRIVFDGFPRSLVTLESFNQELRRSEIPISHVAGIHLLVSEKTAKDRYFVRDNLSGRPESFDERLTYFKRSEIPTIAEFGRIYKLIERHGPILDSQVQECLEFR